MKKIVLLLTLVLGLSQAQEFVSVGHKSLGMAGIGVAYKNNPHAMFFNPALIGARTGLKIAYNFGGSLNAGSVLDIFANDFSNIQDLDAFKRILHDSSSIVSAQFALGIQIPEFSSKVGNFAIGYVSNSYTNISLIGQIPDTENFSNFDFDNSGIYLKMMSLTLQEVPIIYAYTFASPIGEFNVGASLKFMNARYSSTNTNMDQNTEYDSLYSLSPFSSNLGSMASKNNVGLDVGVHYTPLSLESLGVGLVVKNLNAPSFNFNDYRLRIDPQARVGVAYELNSFTSISADLDLTNNRLITTNEFNLRSQKIGLGASFDLLFLSLRAGIAEDFRQDNGVIWSAGLGFGFLDFSISASSKNTKIENTTIPKYIAVQLGGGFSF